VVERWLNTDIGGVGSTVSVAALTPLPVLLRIMLPDGETWFVANVAGVRSGWIVVPKLPKFSLSGASGVVDADEAEEADEVEDLARGVGVTTEERGAVPGRGRGGVSSADRARLLFRLPWNAAGLRGFILL
jgi:hypothetical protein